METRNKHKTRKQNKHKSAAMMMIIQQGLYRGADKSLARPGRKQARKHVKERA